MTSSSVRPVAPGPLPGSVNVVILVTAAPVFRRL
jgi:hypothetical protein